MMLVDISGAREALDMENAASEIFGFTHSLFYNDDKAVSLRTNYNNSTLILQTSLPSHVSTT